MTTFHDLMGGFSVALTPQHLLLALVGCLLGTLIGVLPGVGPVAGVALLIPFTYSLDPAGAIIMLAAIFYGTQYGGTITSVLLNTPGEASSAITCIDGYEMTRRGRAGAALTIAALGSFIGGTVATIGLIAAAQPLAKLGLRIGPPEFFALMVLGISLLTGLAGRSFVKALISGALGLLLAMVGIDPVAGLPRFTFGQAHFFDGVSFVAILVGLFGLSELLASSGSGGERVKTPGMRQLLPSRTELRRSGAPMARGTVIGLVLGLIPGMTGSISSLLSYGAERKVSRFRSEMGRGAIEGVAGPETANNAHSIGALVPLFTLGIPASPTIAVLTGAFLMNGLTPGPRLFTEHPDVAWGLIASLFIGNIILLVLNVPLVRLWTAILAIPEAALTGLIVSFLVIGTYTINGSSIDILVMVAAGLLGLAFRKYDIPLAPLVLTLILGPLMESSLRESLDISRGDFSIFWSRPISLTVLLIALAIVMTPLLRLRSKPRPGVFVDAEV